MDFYDKTLADFLETDLTSVQDFIHRRTKNSQKVFYLVYGDALDQKADLSRLNTSEKQNFANTINAIKKVFAEKKFKLADICECSEEDIKIYLPTFNLSAKNYELLKKVFGANYSDFYDLSNLTISEIPVYNQLLITLKNKFENIKRQNNYDLTYQGKIILNVLRCSKEELEIFKKMVLGNRRKIKYAFYVAFGSSLDRPANLLNLNKEQLNDFLEGVELGKQVITNYREEYRLEREEKAARKNDLVQKIKAQKRKQKTREKLPSIDEQIVTSNEEKVFLLDILGCTKEDLTMFIEKLGVIDESYWALRKAFGDDFSHPLDLTYLTPRELKNYDRALKSLHQFKLQMLPYIVNASLEDIKRVVSKINDQSERYKVLVKVHGPNFDQAKDLSQISKEERIFYYDAISYIKRAVNRKIEEPKYLYEILNCSEDEMYNLLLGIEPNSKKYQVLVKAHGPNFKQVKNASNLTAEEKGTYNTTISGLRKKIKNHKDKQKNFYLTRMLKCKAEDLQNVIAQMDWSLPIYQVLAKAYNNDFTGPKVAILTQEENKIYEEAKTYLRNALAEQKAKNQKTYLWDYIGCNPDELLNLISLLDPNSKSYQVLVKIYGETFRNPKNIRGLTKAEKQLYGGVKVRLKNLYQHQNKESYEKKTEIEVLWPKEIYENNPILVLIPYLPEKYQQIMYLYLSTTDINQVAKIMNESNENIAKCLKIIYSWFKDVSLAYLKDFETEMPILEIKNKQIRQRLPKNN